jgi:hypothetical protein
MPYQFASRQVTAPDPDGSKLAPIPCGGASQVSIGGTCTGPRGMITVRLIFTEQTGGFVVGCSAPLVLTTGSVADWGAAYLGVPADEYQTPPVPACALNAYLKVDSVVGTWSLSTLAYFPPGTTPPF